MAINFKDIKNLSELQKKFPDEVTCIKHLELIRWNGGVVSPFDENSKVYSCAGYKYKCKNTGKYFNVRTKTIFEDSNLPLQKWFSAIYLISTGKAETPKTLSNYLEVTLRTASSIKKRIDYAFNHENFKQITNDSKSN